MSVQGLVSARAASGSEQALEPVLARIAASAGELDREPRFPAENFADLRLAGGLLPGRDGLIGEVRLVRAVAGADASTARILDGHLNGLERLGLARSASLPAGEIERIARGELLVGVWGADPSPGEGPPARLVREGERLVLRGVKTFCSGAGGVQRALVLAYDEEDERRIVYLDTTAHVSIDRGWYRASGLRASESHRVEFHDTPALALLGGPGELSREPWFSRDAIRTSATWAGLVDCILAETVRMLDPERLDAVQAHGLGRMRVAQGTIDRWLEHTATALAGPVEGCSDVDAGALAVECRIAMYESALIVSSLAARVCGSRALIGGSALDRARRDLDLFLLQHRLDPKIAKLGAGLLAKARL